MDNPIYEATGRRKESTARVRVTAGSGQIVINKLQADAYFSRPTLVMQVEQPLKITELLGTVDITVSASGGGLSGQAGAVRLGIARALEKLNPDLRPALKKAGFLTRDSRMVERKKYGQPGARKQFQFSKR
jgi:small subunit ribosomal protein S9